MAESIFPALISGLFGTVNNAANVAHSKKENEKNRKFNADEAAKNRAFQSQEAELNRNFQSKEAELAYDRQVDFYNTYQSPAAMVQQYKDAGLNPALLAGGVSPSSTPSSPAASGSAASGSAASAGASPIPAMQDILSAIVDFQSIKASIDETKARTRQIDAETEQINKNTSWIDILNTTNVDSMKANMDQIRSNISLNAQKVQESIQSVQESIKRMDKMSSDIEVNGSIISLNGSQEELNVSKSAVEKLNAEKMELLLPYVQAHEEARISLATAQTSETLNSAEEKMYEADFKMLQVLKEQKLIDSSYYDSVIDSAHWSSKYKKREYKWFIVSNICSNISKLLIGAGSLSSGIGNL